MKNAIIEKLRKELDEGISTEAQAVYLLCQVRKVLHANKPEPAPKDLNLFCHWALHVTLRGKDTTTHFLQRIDDVLVDYFEKPTEAATLQRDDALKRELAHFWTFRSELRGFLEAHDLPTDLCDQNERWSQFLLAYCRVIEDGVLTAALNLLDRVVFRIDPTVTLEDARLPFTMEWRLDLKRPMNSYSTYFLRIAANDSGLISSSFGIATR